jgi:hypothetical protein
VDKIALAGFIALIPCLMIKLVEKT